MSKVVAITGVNGHFGRVLLPLLEKDPEFDRIICVDLVPPSLEASKLVFHRCDIRESKIERLFAKVDTVVHLAAMMFPGPGKESLAVDVNINGSHNVFEAAARAGIRKLVFASSIAVYGHHPDNDQPLTEESPIRPDEESPYSKAKAANEKYLDSFSIRHPDMVITRLRPTFGIGPSAPDRMFASKFSEGTRATLFIPRGPEYPINLIHEQDLASAFHLVIKRDAPGIFNIAGDEPELLSELARSVGVKVRALPLSLMKLLLWINWRRGKTPIRPSDISVSVKGPCTVSAAKIERELGWRPKYTTRQALMATLQAIEASKASQ